MGVAVALVFLAILIALALRNAGSAGPTAPTASPPQIRPTPSSLPRGASARNAWLSGDLQQMIGALAAEAKLVDRHFLLMTIVQQTYRQRADPTMADKCAEVAQLHLDEFDQIKPALKRDMGFLPHVPTFQHYATLLTERGEFERAMNVCEAAIGHGLDDGTKGGYRGRIERIKKMRAKAKLASGAAAETSGTPTTRAKQVVPSTDSPQIVETLATSHQKRTRVQTARVLDLEGVPFVGLPRAPARWEERDTAKAQREDDGAEDFFELLGQPGWELLEPEKLPMTERPDPAYRRHFSARSGTFLVDDLGRAKAHSGAPCSVMSFGAQGEPLAERALAWDLYRLQVNPLGAGLAGISRNHVLHCYDERLTTLAAVPLAETPEVRAAKSRLEIPDLELHRHIRTGALRPDGKAYLFSVVDEAFAVGIDGDPLFGVRMPHQDGWEQVGSITSRSGSSTELDQAMSALGLAYPFDSQDVKGRYRQLVKEWHPDKNPGREQEAASEFRKIVSAAELLSGFDMSEFAAPEERAVYRKTLGERGEISAAGVTISFEMSISGDARSAADWIYAASFSASGGAFVAGYSGKIVELDQTGQPTRLFATSSVPRRIADTGDYLYFLTDTRLYVIRGTRLCRVVDVFDNGELVVGETGFGLLGKKAFRWYSEDGRFAGGIRTKHPLRRIYPTAQGWRAETRQHRAELRNVPAWREQTA